MDLLEMLLTLRKENDSLREELELVKKKLADRMIKTENSDSREEPIPQLDGTFEPETPVCEQRTENMRPGVTQQDRKTIGRCVTMIVNAKKQVEMYGRLLETLGQDEAE